MIGCGRGHRLASAAAAIATHAAIGVLAACRPAAGAPAQAIAAVVGRERGLSWPRCMARTSVCHRLVDDRLVLTQLAVGHHRSQHLHHHAHAEQRGDVGGVVWRRHLDHLQPADALRAATRPSISTPRAAGTLQARASRCPARSRNRPSRHRTRYRPRLHPSRRAPARSLLSSPARALRCRSMVSTLVLRSPRLLHALARHLPTADADLHQVGWPARSADWSPNTTAWCACVRPGPSPGCRCGDRNG